MRLLRRSRDENALRIFYAADIHGSDTCWRKFLKAGKFYGVDVLTLGGDLTGKAMVAVVRGAAGTSFDAGPSPTLLTAVSLK